MAEQDLARGTLRFTSLLVLFGIVLTGEALAQFEGADTSAWRLEAGYRWDLSTEVFYEETFDDTTFRARQLNSTPEFLHLGVLRGEWLSSRGGRANASRAGLELIAGDRLQQMRADGRVDRSWGGDWRITLDPKAEWRHDRSFDRDRSEWRAGGVMRARREFADGVSRLLALLGSEVLRSDGAVSEYVLDRDVVSTSLGFDRSPWDGPQIRAEYGAALRAFPDSSTRDHLGQHAELEFRRDADDGSRHGVLIRLDRRNALDAIASTRDRFFAGQTELVARLGLPAPWSLDLRATGEFQRYDSPDSSVYFDYQVAGFTAQTRWDPARFFSVQAGPRLEWLRSPWSPGSGYAESAAALELEWITSRGLWTISPAAGWREYRDAPAGDLAAQSSYAFTEATLIGDQELPAKLRVRAFAYARLEWHTASTEDARSLYFSLDVRRVF